EFTAIINPPQACILAVGSTRDVFTRIPKEFTNREEMALPSSACFSSSSSSVRTSHENIDGQFEKIMTLTLSCDHRVVDGALGAQFLNSVKKYLEDPLSLLM